MKLTNINKSQILDYKITLGRRPKNMGGLYLLVLGVLPFKREVVETNIIRPTSKKRVYYKTALNVIIAGSDSKRELLLKKLAIDKKLRDGDNLLVQFKRD